tara:strand:+ start:240 stop:404 length:165 start_codon:yes stop_codon:yes gene_type:complete
MEVLVLELLTMVIVEMRTTDQLELVQTTLMVMVVQVLLLVLVEKVETLMVLLVT